MSQRALNNEQFGEHLPPEPGSQSIPEGHVRLWHYTGEEALPSIREQGLSRQHARGSTYGEPNVVWAAAHKEAPAKDALYQRPHVEFHADPSRRGDLDIGEHYGQGGSLGEHIEHLYSHRSHVTMRGDVPPSRILAVHEPWHAHARYLESDPQTLHDYTQGDFKDYDTGDPHTDKALAYVRAKHAAGGYE
jgi:hypothetical protein